MRTLVIGANGQLGQELAHLVGTGNSDWTFWRREQLDLTQTDAIASAITEHRPEVIINCSAYTAVDKAESEPELADAINHLAVAQMAQAAKALDATLIHVSTDYVFDGTHYKPYTPDHPTNPQGQYGASKLAGEQAFIASGARGIIIRTSWVYSAFGNNFVGTMLRLGRERDSLNVVADQVGSPTWARDLARAVLHVRQHPTITEKRGAIYHYSNAGVCSWYDFTTCIMDIAGLDCAVNPIPSEAYPTPAQRPHFSVLDSHAILEDFDVTQPHWLASLKLALPEFVR